MSSDAPILVSGATGLIGTRLLETLAGEGRPVRALTRRPGTAALGPGAEAVGWDGIQMPAPALSGAGAAVHLSGEPVFGGLPTAGRRRRMSASRIESTRSLVATLAGLRSTERPSVLVCASAVGFYGSRGEEQLDESSEPGSGFLADLCRDWEAAAFEARAHGVRVVALRIGVVLAAEGGALVPLARLFRLGLGGRVGDGRQWFPWVHADDVVELVRACLDDPAFSGPVNAVAPGSVRNAEFTRTLAAAVKRPALLPVPGFAVRAALGDLAGELLGSRRVTPARALERGFAFQQPRLAGALARELGGG